MWGSVGGHSANRACQDDLGTFVLVCLFDRQAESVSPPRPTNTMKCPPKEEGVMMMVMGHSRGHVLMLFTSTHEFKCFSRGYLDETTALKAYSHLSCIVWMWNQAVGTKQLEQSVARGLRACMLRLAVDLEGSISRSHS